MEQKTIQSIEWWLKTGSVYGLGWITLACIMGIFLYVLFFGSKEFVGILRASRLWIPQVAQAHISFVDQTKQTGERMTVAVETMSDAQTQSGRHHAKTHRTLAIALRAAREGVEQVKASGHMPNPDRVLRLIDEAEEELEKP